MGRAICVACDGDGELAVDAEPRFTTSAAANVRIVRLFEASRFTLRMARRYLLEGGASDRRFIACLVQVRAYRMSIRYQRSLVRPKLGELAWCINCRGTGLARIECEGCGRDVSLATVNRDALDNVDVLVHEGCDTGHRFFDVVLDERRSA